MNCKDFESYGSAYIDNMLSNEEKLEFENHINDCKSCNIKLKNLKTIVESVNEVEEVELPINFLSELKSKLEIEKNYKSKNTILNRNKILSTIVAGLLIIMTSVSLMNNFSIYKNKNNLYSEMERLSKNKDNVTFDNSSEKSIEKPLDTEKVPLEPRIMTIENIDKNKESENQITENKESENQVTENKYNKVINMLTILFITSGAGMLIYKKLKR